MVFFDLSDLQIEAIVADTPAVEEALGLALIHPPIVSGFDSPVVGHIDRF